MLTVDHLTARAEDRGGSRLSLFMPTRRSGFDASANRIRLKNLLRHTAERMVTRDAVAATLRYAPIEPAEGRRP